MPPGETCYTNAETAPTKFILFWITNTSTILTKSVEVGTHEGGGSRCTARTLTTIAITGRIASGRPGGSCTFRRPRLAAAQNRRKRLHAPRQAAAYNPGVIVLYPVRRRIRPTVIPAIPNNNSTNVDGSGTPGVTVMSQ